MLRGAGPETPPGKVLGADDAVGERGEDGRELVVDGGEGVTAMFSE